MVITHSSENVTEFVCEICAYSTPSSMKLQRHKYEKHEVENHKQCPHCDFKAPYDQKVKIHIVSKLVKK